MGALLVTLLLVPRPALSGAEQLYDADAHFRVHYTLDGADALARGALDADPADGVPDDVNEVAGALDQSWRRWVEGAGMRAPLPDGTLGGDGRIDVYLRKLDGPRGYTHPEPASMASGAATSVWIELEVRTMPHRLAAAAAHEAQHAMQYAYTSRLAPWIYEASATFVEVRDYDLADERAAHLRHLLDAPGVPLDTVDGAHEYDELAFVAFLMDGAPGQEHDEALAALWAAMGDAGDAVAGIERVRDATMAEVLYDYAWWLRGRCDVGSPYCVADTELRMTYVGAGGSTKPLRPLALAVYALDSCAAGYSMVLGDAQGVAWGTESGRATRVTDDGPTELRVDGSRPLVLARGPADKNTVELARTGEACAVDADTTSDGGVTASPSGGCSLGRGAEENGAGVVLSLALLLVGRIRRRWGRAARPSDPAPPSPA